MNEVAGVLPHSKESEVAMLGSLLLGNPEAMLAMDSLKPEFFFVPQHRIVFSAVSAIIGISQTPDLVSVVEFLNENEQLEAAGGVKYISRLSDGVPRNAPVREYVARLRDKSLLRSIARIGESISANALNGGEPAALIDSALRLFSDLESEAGEHAEVSYLDAATSLMMSLDAPKRLRIKTGLPRLDEATGGFLGGELVIFTAGPGMGKTLLAQQTRRHACQQGYRGLYCSGEMLATHLLGRELATQAGVSHWKMRQSEQLNELDMRALAAAAQHECNRCSILDSGMELGNIRRVARKMHRQISEGEKDGLDLLIVDYDELVEAPGANEFEQQKSVVVGLKKLAMQLKCVVLLISQLRKALSPEEAENPSLERLYGHGSKIKTANIILFVDRKFVRELQGSETEARFVLLKNRDGVLGKFDGQFNIHTLRFEDAPLQPPLDAGLYDS